MSLDRFPYRVPLLNASLVEDDAVRAATLLQGGGQARGAVDALHRHVADAWAMPYVASFMGGRSALFAIVRALGLQPGDQVLVPAFTCQAVTNAFSFQGIEVRFIDIELDTFGMDAAAARQAITLRTRAILLQYTFGLVCRDMDALCDLARQRGLRLIEDCAHATGGTYRGQLLGTFGDIAFFSSERSKIVNSIHGGWAMTRDPDLGAALAGIHASSPVPDADHVRSLLGTMCLAYRQRPDVAAATLPACLADLPAERVAAVPQMQAAELSGLFTPQYGWRMPDAIAALLLPQLQRLDQILARRRAGARYWQRWAERHRVQHARVLPDSDPAWLRFPILVDEPIKRCPGDLADQLGCEIGVWFTTPMHPHALTLPDCPQGMQASRRCVNLPTWLPDQGV
ncbi:DegT/DnrJ/EryC1/StrS family aminotransferase [Castellaniella ginsengisoli]|uniref:DegT/DnrJ/EryC1/StrS family aminotransferase n=1 Tax=Castellaniella sp. TaxID=1955812 RepID=UPI002AFE8F5A|nr:aminotransferase class I/II-fold pyridoxal phosphate-dependent enzyme [Castellaniella sp.]